LELDPGVPDKMPADVSVTPGGSAPVSENVGTGDPSAVTVNEPAEPAVNVVLLRLVIVGAWGALIVSVLVPWAYSDTPPVQPDPKLEKRSTTKSRAYVPTARDDDVTTDNVALDVPFAPMVMHPVGTPADSEPKRPLTLRTS